MHLRCVSANVSFRLARLCKYFNYCHFVCAHWQWHEAKQSTNWRNVFLCSFFLSFFLGLTTSFISFVFSGTGMVAPVPVCLVQTHITHMYWQRSLLQLPSRHFSVKDTFFRDRRRKEKRYWCWVAIMNVAELWSHSTQKSDKVFRPRACTASKLWNPNNLKIS